MSGHCFAYALTGHFRFPYLSVKNTVPRMPHTLHWFFCLFVCLCLCFCHKQQSSALELCSARMWRMTCTVDTAAKWRINFIQSCSFLGPSFAVIVFAHWLPLPREQNFLSCQLYAPFMSLMYISKWCWMHSEEVHVEWVLSVSLKFLLKCRFSCCR